MGAAVAIMVRLSKDLAGMLQYDMHYSHVPEDGVRTQVCHVPDLGLG